MPMTHAERRARRKRIADLVESGKSLAEAAQEVGLGAKSAWDACKEFGVATNPPGRKATTALVVLGFLFENPAMSLRECARFFDVSPQYIHQLYHEAREAGIPVPERKHHAEAEG